MTEVSSDATTTKGPGTDHRSRLRSATVPLLTFLAGIGSTLFTQSFIGHQQLLHAKRETRVAVLRDYTAACYGDAVQLSELANLPVHFEAIWKQPDLSPKERTQQMIRMDWESVEHGHKAMADLAVQAEIVNALFETKVDPIGIVNRDMPPEFNVMPGEVNPEKLMERIKEDPLAVLKRYAPLLGRQSKALSDYCQESVQALSKEID